MTDRITPRYSNTPIHCPALRVIALGRLQPASILSAHCLLSRAGRFYALWVLLQGRYHNLAVCDRHVVLGATVWTLCLARRLNGQVHLGM